MADRVVMKCSACGFGRCLYGKPKTECDVPKTEVADTSDTKVKRKREPKLAKHKFTFN